MYTKQTVRTDSVLQCLLSVESLPAPVGGGTVPVWYCFAFVGWNDSAFFFSNVSGLSRFIPMKDFLNEVLQIARVCLTQWYLLLHLLLEVGLLSLAPFSTVFKYWVFFSDGERTSLKKMDRKAVGKECLEVSFWRSQLEFYNVMMAWKLWLGWVSQGMRCGLSGFRAPQLLWQHGAPSHGTSWGMWNGRQTSSFFLEGLRTCSETSPGVNPLFIYRTMWGNL